MVCGLMCLCGWVSACVCECVYVCVWVCLCVWVSVFVHMCVFMGNIHTLQLATILAVSIDDSAHEIEILCYVRIVKQRVCVTVVFMCTCSSYSVGSNV